jgi:hypothetical protein
MPGHLSFVIGRAASMRLPSGQVWAVEAATIGSGRPGVDASLPQSRLQGRIRWQARRWGHSENYT